VENTLGVDRHQAIKTMVKKTDDDDDDDDEFIRRVDWQTVYSTKSSILLFLYY